MEYASGEFYFLLQAVHWTTRVGHLNQFADVYSKVNISGLISPNSTEYRYKLQYNEAKHSVMYLYFI